MLNQSLENICEGLLHACISSLIKLILVQMSNTVKPVLGIYCTDCTVGRIITFRTATVDLLIIGVYCDIKRIVHFDFCVLKLCAP
jgi:hypothetical protein